VEWRKEKNSWIDSPVRNSLTYAERDVYTCLRCLAGSDTGRWGFIERNELVPLTVIEISFRLGETELLVKTVIDKLLSMGVLSECAGHYLFVQWDEEQSKNKTYKPTKPLSDREAELHDRMQLERLMVKYPDEVNGLVDKRISGIIKGGSSV
jgi:hypothetical protein